MCVWNSYREQLSLILGFEKFVLKEWHMSVCPNHYGTVGKKCSMEYKRERNISSLLWGEFTKELVLNTVADGNKLL